MGLMAYDIEEAFQEDPSLDLEANDVVESGEYIYNAGYLRKQVARFNEFFDAGNEDAAIDCLWRVASNADLYSPEEMQQFTENGMSDEIQDEILDFLDAEGFEIDD